MAARRSGSVTTTNTHGWRFSALSACVAASNIRAMSASGTGSGRKSRHARCASTTSKKSGTVLTFQGEAAHVVDAEPGMDGPRVEVRRSSGAEALRDERCHLFERRLRIVVVHFVEVQEAWLATADAFVGRDHRVARHADGGDVVEVHELSPVT